MTKQVHPYKSTKKLEDIKKNLKEHLYHTKYNSLFMMVNNEYCYDFTIEPLSQNKFYCKVVVFYKKLMATVRRHKISPDNLKPLIKKIKNKMIRLKKKEGKKQRRGSD